MKFKSQLTTMVSGSINGLVGSHNRGGQYFRSRVVPTDPGTAAQTEIRNIFADLANTWANVLTPTERTGWNTYADQVPWINTLGEEIRLTGINHFIGANSVRAIITNQLGGSAPRVDTAPSSFTRGLQPQLNPITATHATGPPETISVPITWTNASEYGGTDQVIVYVSPPQNPGIKFFKGPYYAITSDVADAGTITASLFSSTAPNRYEQHFGPVVAGQSVFVALRVTMADGRLSGLVRQGPIPIPVAS